MATLHSSRAIKKKPLYAPCNTLQMSDTVYWLKQGWQDYKASWKLSAGYGLFFAVATAAITAFFWFYGNRITLFSMGFLFFLLAPIFCFGLYDVSKELQEHHKPTVKHSLQQMIKNAGSHWVYGIMLVVVGLLWLRAAFIIHIFYPSVANPTLSDMASFLMVGSTVGAFFAALVFSSAAFSLPMIMDRNTETVTAVLTSMNAAIENPGVALLWAFIIFGMVAVGVLTGFLGLIVVMPLLGYASYHAYESAIVTERSQDRKAAS